LIGRTSDPGALKPALMLIMRDLLISLLLSMRIAVGATLLSAAAAIPLANLLARRDFPAKRLLETLLMLPLVLPPTVVGYGIIYGLGVHSPLGQWMLQNLGFRLLFSEPGAVLAGAIVAFPLLLIPARSAFAAVERELEDIARLMGANPWQIFRHVSLPMARRGIGGGLLLAFARALGEFGATVMVFGTARKTLPVLIWYASEAGAMRDALPAVGVLLATSVIIMAVYNRAGFGRQE
jgi:molybdate transport system permease protein